MENVQEVLSNVAGTLNLKTLSWDAALRVAVLVLVGMAVIRVLMKLVDRLLERSKSLASLHVYIRSMSVAGLAVSLALQNTLSNLAGGIMLLVTKPFQVGDYVEADGVGGTIAAVDLSYTTFVTVDNKEIFVPNSQLSAAKIVNYSALGRRRVELTVNASYDAPTQTVKEAIQEVLDAIPQIQPDPAPAIWLSAYQSSSIQYVVRVWTTAGEYYAIQEGLRESFTRHGIEMTYDHLNVHILER